MSWVSWCRATWGRRTWARCSRAISRGNGCSCSGYRIAELADSFQMSPIGYVRSALADRHGAPRQAWEGAPEAQIEVREEFVEALDGIEAGQEVWVLTFL